MIKALVSEPMAVAGHGSLEDSATLAAVDAKATAPAQSAATEAAQGDGRQDAPGRRMAANTRNLTLRIIKSWFVDDVIT